jgi:Fe-S cluster assembly iron-binding protein IscA
MIHISKKANERLKAFEQSDKEKLFRIFISGIG